MTRIGESLEINEDKKEIKRVRESLEIWADKKRDEKNWRKPGD
jgi:hypothetical protein